LSISINENTIQRILLIRLSSIGDVLFASPVAEKLRQRFPKAHITWVVETKSKDVIEGNPFLDEVIVWSRKSWNKHARQNRDYLQLIHLNYNFSKSIRALQPDLVINMQDDFRSAVLTHISGAKYRICPANFRKTNRCAANVLVDNTVVKHSMLKYVSLLSPLGIDFKDTHMTMPFTSKDIDYANGLLSEQGLQQKQFVVLNPAASSTKKLWPANYYAVLADLLIEKCNTPIVFLGADSDRALVAEVTCQMKHKAYDLSGKTTLKQLGALVQKAQLFISGDTGPLHIAAAVGTPTVSLFGPTDPERYAPLGDLHRIITGKTMHDIKPSEVFQAACTFLVCED